jgi:hypothetical protein
LHVKLEFHEKDLRENLHTIFFTLMLVKNLNFVKSYAENRRFIEGRKNILDELDYNGTVVTLADNATDIPTFIILINFTEVTTG